MAATEAARGAVWEGVAARAVMEERAARVAVGEAAAAQGAAEHGGLDPLRVH